MDGQYTVYGETIEGLEVIDKIAAVATGAQKRDLPNEPVQIICIREIEQASAESDQVEETKTEEAAQTPAE